MCAEKKEEDELQQLQDVVRQKELIRSHWQNTIHNAMPHICLCLLQPLMKEAKRSTGVEENELPEAALLHNTQPLFHGRRTTMTMMTMEESKEQNGEAYRGGLIGRLNRNGRGFAVEG